MRIGLMETLKAVSPQGADCRLRIMAIGGTTRVGSTSERILRIVADRVSKLGADVQLFGATELDLPMYGHSREGRAARCEEIVTAMRRAHGFIIASPGYHGSISGLIKNALDYAEHLREESPPYWDGRAVGLIACAAGWQATGSTMMAMRAVVHSLRGWPTPMGVSLNTCISQFSQDGSCLLDPNIDHQLTVLSEQVLEFAAMRMITESAARRVAHKSTP